jgi:glycosyltransferase involved in cell wall biosynthesis
MLDKKPRLLRITTVPISLHLLLKGQPQFMQSNGFKVLTVSADGKELAAIKSSGIPHQIINLTRKISPIADTIALWKMIQLIKSFKPDIVHTHTPKAGLIGMMAAFICRVPIRLHTVAGLPVMEALGLKKSLLILTEKITCFCANNVYPNSNGLMVFMINNFRSFKHKFKVLGKGSTNGIITKHYSLTPELSVLADHLKSKYNIQPSDFVFCFIGRLVGDKGINELINVFDCLSKNNNCKLLLVGMQEPELDPLSANCLEIIHNNKNIISLGYQDDVRVALTASNVFVFPSYREGFPNVVMQAQSMGVPCIVSDINGCNELVTHQESGLIVPVKNETALQEAMCILMNDTEKCKSFASIARENILQHYEQSQVWNYILNEYKQMLSKN